jgi:hypothetical protein
MNLLYVFKERAPTFIELAWRISLSSASRLLAYDYWRYKHMHLRLLTITSLITGIGLAVSAIAQPAVPTKEMVVTPFEQVKFVPIDPIKPNGDQIAVAEGDPASGLRTPHVTFPANTGFSRHMFREQEHRQERIGVGMTLWPTGPTRGEEANEIEINFNTL